MCCCDLLILTYQISQHYNPRDCTISLRIIKNLMSATHSGFSSAEVQIKALAALCVR